MQVINPAPCALTDGMIGKTHRDARSLFVLSNDYGELVLAMSMLHGQRFAKNAALALPSRLFHHHKKGLAITTFEYTILEDIFDLVESWNADIVFLFSGYLFAYQGLLSNASLKNLASRLRSRDCCLATSDPWLGLGSQLSASDINFYPRQGRELPPSELRDDLHLRERNFAIDLYVASQILKDCAHIYPSMTEGVIPRDGVRRLSFFNETTAHISAAHRASMPGGGVGSNDKEWIFIIATTDCWYQRWLWGAAYFSDLVASKLEEVRKMGRRPTLIAPLVLTDDISKRLKAGSGIRLISFCPYTQFIPLLLRAEYVFYWNCFSASLLVRWSEQRPVFFFDRGHMARVVGAIYPLGLQCYYLGWKPSYLDQTEPLDLNVLEVLAEDQRPAIRSVLEHRHLSPTPDQLVDMLLRGQCVSGELE
jgi:hypothetical protein